MKKFAILILIVNGLCGVVFGQRFIPMNFTQPASLAAIAGNDTLICRGHAVVLGGNPTAAGGNSGYVYLWYPADGLNDPTLSNPTVTPGETTSYRLTVTDSHDCQAISFITITVDQCLGINDRDLHQKVTVFPNPSDGFFTIQGLSAVIGELQKIEVFNQLGKVVYSRRCQPGDQVSDILLDTNIKDPGIYYLKISLDNQLFTQRLIVR